MAILREEREKPPESFPVVSVIVTRAKKKKKGISEYKKASSAGINPSIFYAFMFFVTIIMFSL